MRTLTRSALGYAAGSKEHFSALIHVHSILDKSYNFIFLFVFIQRSFELLYNIQL